MGGTPVEDHRARASSQGPPCELLPLGPPPPYRISVIWRYFMKCVNNNNRLSFPLFFLSIKADKLSTLWFMMQVDAID